MPGALQMGKPHHRHEIPHVKARRRRIEAAVAGHDACAERGIERLGVLVQQSAPRELGEQRIHVGHRTNINDTRGCVTTAALPLPLSDVSISSFYG